MEYDENTVLARYVCNHYRHLMTDFEIKVMNASFWRIKQSLTDGNMPRMMEKYTLPTDEDINRALLEGHDMFQRKVCERILRDHNEEIFINRCSKCNCIVRTPKAKLCLWCGYSWFDKD